MTPHTILSDQAISAPFVDFPGTASNRHGDLWPKATTKDDSSTAEFSSYVNKLLSESPQDPSSGLLSPTEADVTSPNAAQSNALIKNRVGETLPCLIDFQDGQIKSYALHSSLESWETVDPTIALRSKASIHRATRKVFASRHDSTISASRITFSPTIPSTAVPDFLTSGIKLEWGLRFEFATERVVRHDNDDNGNDDDENEDEAEQSGVELLEEVQRSERGTVRVAVQGLLCETFDVTVPIRVYGAVGPLDEHGEAGEFRI